MKPILPAFLLLAAALFLGACTSVSREVTPTAPVPPTTSTPARPESSKNLRKGMTEAEIRAVWGEPKAVHAGNIERETILVYNFDVLTTQRMVAATVNKWQTVDPISGVPRTVIDPVLSPQQVTVFQSIVLQLIDGKLVSWARKLGEDRSFK
jgi:hypothetical protein